MCFSLSLGCSRKEENGNPPGPGKVLAYSNLGRRDLLLYIQGSAAQSCWWWGRMMKPHTTMTLPPLQGCITQGARRSSAGTPSPAAFLQAVWSSTIQGCSMLQVCSSPSLTWDSLAPCWAPLGAAVGQVSVSWPWQATEGAVTQEPLPITREEIHPLPQTRVSVSQITGGIFHLSDKADRSCSLLLLSWAYTAKISPSRLNLTASTGQHKST